MKDFTTGSILSHIIAMAVPMLVGMTVQTLYILVDLYFVSRLGHGAVAGVSSASNIMFVVLALTQMISVATVTLVAHAVGEKDKARANLIFNQSVLMSVLFMVLTLIFGYGFGASYLSTLAADAEIRNQGVSYLFWYLPGLALQFALASLGSGLRGAGVAQPTMVVQLLTVGVNIILAPVLIAGWGTGHPMGVAGAGLASTLAIAIGVVAMIVYFFALETYVQFDKALLKPQLKAWGQMFKIGLPSGGEYFLMFVYSSIIYFTIRDFGAQAQAGYALGGRMMQMLFMPTLAVSFAIPAVAGQNFGARSAARVKETFYTGVKIELIMMGLIVLLCQLHPSLLLTVFSQDPEVLRVGAGFLRIVSWNFFASGLVFACSGLFQAMGNTVPGLISSALRLVTFALPVVLLSQQKNFQLDEIWWISVASVAVQACISLLFVRWQFGVKLKHLTPATPIEVDGLRVEA